MTKITIRDTRGACTYEASFHASGKQRMLKYIESSYGNDYIIYLDGYNVGAMNDDEFDEFKGLFRLRFRKHEDVSDADSYDTLNEERDVQPIINIEDRDFDDGEFHHSDAEPDSDW